MILEEDQLFDCDMFVFCASRGVPPVGATGDVRMAQFEANRGLVELYAKAAVSAGFGGIFAVVSIRWILCARRQSWRDCRRTGCRDTAWVS